MGHYPYGREKKTCYYTYLDPEVMKLFFGIGFAFVVFFGVIIFILNSLMQ